MTTFRPLQVGDYRFIATDEGTYKLTSPFPFSYKHLTVVAFSPKSGGKNGKHCDITESSTFAAA